MRLTCVQNQLIYAIIERGGRVSSLLKLSDELGIGYFHSWHLLRRLEAEGLVTVERRSGYPLVMVCEPQKFERFVILASAQNPLI